jgi:hypothetical protein
MDRVANHRWATRLLLLIALTGGIGMSIGSVPGSAGAAESRTPVIRPVEEPKAGDPADPDFGQMRGSYAPMLQRSLVSDEMSDTVRGWSFKEWFSFTLSWLIPWCCARRLG